MPTNISKIEEFLSSHLVKAVITLVTIVFMAGAFYTKIQDRLAEMPKEIASEILVQLNGIERKVDSHIISEGYEIKILKSQVIELNKYVDDIRYDIQYRIKQEGVKPDEVEIKNNKSKK